MKKKRPRSGIIQPRLANHARKAKNKAETRVSGAHLSRTGSLGEWKAKGVTV